MNINTSPIDFSCFQEDEMDSIPREILEILTRKIFRGRDYIRTNEERLRRRNLPLAHKVTDLFFDFWVTHYINEIESLPPTVRWPRHLMERLAKAFSRAIYPIDRYNDPFSLLPNSF